MKLAFCLFKYFSYGGLQRDFLHIAKACENRGHEIHVYTMDLQGELPPTFHLHLLKKRGWQNHQRLRGFVKQLKSALSNHPYDLVIGFNKMPYLDIYYAADVCYQSRAKEKHGIFYRILPRYRTLRALENAVFARGNKTHILVIAQNQAKEYEQCYQTEPERFTLLPPGITKDRIAPPNADQIRKKIRAEHHLTDDTLLILMIGSGFKTKGLDRAIKSLAALPIRLRERCRFIVIGEDNPSVFIKLAREHHVNTQLTFLGGRNDAAHFLLAADLLIHPAYHENTGTVLLEAVVCGCPVLTVDVCGYAHYVRQAKAGIVLSSPFNQEELNHTLEKMLSSPDYFLWKEQGLIFAAHANLYDMPEKAADFIEQIKWIKKT